MTVLLQQMSRIVRKDIVLSIAVILALSTSLFVTPSVQYLEYIDFKVLVCLFVLMVIIAGIRKHGALDLVSRLILELSNNSRTLAQIIIFTTFIMSMLITNDVALLTFTPLSLYTFRNIKNKASIIKIVVLQTIAANVGSSLTPIGNPQNLFLFSFYSLDALSFFSVTTLIAISGGLLLALSTYTIAKEQMNPADKETRLAVNIHKSLFYCVLFILAVLAVFNVCNYFIILALCVASILLLDKELFRQVDYSLLATFLAFFIFIGNLQQSELIGDVMEALLSVNVIAVSALCSQCISNVPAAMLLSGYTADYSGLIKGVSIGGMGTLIASLASVISYKFFNKSHPELSGAYLLQFTIWNFAFLLILYLVCLV